MALAKQSAVQEQKPAAKNKLRMLIDKYGVSKVREALAMIKKYKPKGLIARVKEAQKELEAAKSTFNACIGQHCNQEHREWNRARRIRRRGTYQVGSKGYEEIQAKIKTYMACMKVHCHQEDSAVEGAYRRLDNLGMVIAIAVPLGIFTASSLAGLGVMVLVPGPEQSKPWSQPSPVYEAPKN